MYKLSQFQNNLSASNPASGINNIELNSESEGITPDQMITVLNKVVNHEGNDHTLILSELEQTLLEVKDPEIKQKISTIINALNMANDPRKQTIDPETGEKDPGPQELASKLIQIVKNKIPTENKMATVYNHKTAQKVIKKKKKTRGNPFRVLMGKVGKLLDHGVEKNDIVRYIAKENKWDKETIGRAVDIVKDYNRKKNQKESSNQSRVITAAYDYDTKPDFEKRSTPELVFRICFLLDLDDYSKSTPQGHGKDAADKKGVKEEITQIRKALTNRGMSKEEMDKLGFGK